MFVIARGGDSHGRGYRRGSFGNGKWKSRNCNKGGQDMDMSLLLLRLERLGHLKIAAGLQATTTILVLSPFPFPPHYFQPLLFFSFFLLPAPLSRFRCACVCLLCSCANFLWLEENNPQVADTLVCVWQCQLGRLQAAKCTCPAFLWPLLLLLLLLLPCVSFPNPQPPVLHLFGTHMCHSRSFSSLSHEYIMPCT